MINLHTHTNKSLDGILDVNDVLNICEENNISYVSITDHDTCDAYKDIKDNNFTGTLIYGIEADALIGKEIYDILCYGFNLKNVSEWAKNKYTTIEERQTIIFNELKQISKKQNIYLDESTPYNPKEEYAHAAIFRMLDNSFKEKYNLTKISDLYRESTINKDFPLYIDMSILWPTIEEVRNVIHENGGLIFLAHPFKYGKKDVNELLKEALYYIDGIEVYNGNTDEEVKFLYDFAKENNLLMSCGSDFHSTENHNDIIVQINDKLEQEIIDWINNNPNKTYFKR